MRVCAKLGSASTQWRGKNLKKKYQKQKVTSRYSSRTRVGAFIQPTAMDVCTFVKVTNVINHDNFGGCM
jgi:hypothetical protein